MTAVDVAIVGGGPTGLTLANILGRRSVRTILVERNPHTVREPRAISIDDESLRTMQGVGLAEAVIENVALNYGSHYHTADGRCFAKVEPTTREYGFPRRNAFTQPKLEATLREGLRRFESVTTLFEHGCDAVAEDGSGVTLELTTPGGAKQEVRARYLVGSDGARSAIRKHIGSTLTGSTYSQRWLIVDLASTKERLRQTRVVCNPARPLLTLPGPAGIRRYEFMLRDDESDDAAVEPDFIRNLLAANGPDVDAPIVRKQVYVFHARIADRWHTKRIFLAGDAAHLSPPFAGQGMNSGIRDSQNLGWKLAEVIAHHAGPGLLDTYEEERKPHAWALIQLAINMGRVMMPSSQAQASLVQLAFGLTRLAPRAQDYFAQMKYKPKPFYQSGFVVPDDSGLEIAGRMMPQPAVDVGGRRGVLLDEIVSDGFTLLSFGPNAQAALSLASALDFGLPDLQRIAVLPSAYNPDTEDLTDGPVARDAAGGLHPFLPVDRDVVLLLRPDRYVAAAALGDAASLVRMAEQVRALLRGTRRPDDYSGDPPSQQTLRPPVPELQSARA